MRTNTAHVSCNDHVGGRRGGAGGGGVGAQRKRRVTGHAASHNGGTSHRVKGRQPLQRLHSLPAPSTRARPLEAAVQPPPLPLLPPPNPSTGTDCAVVDPGGTPAPAPASGPAAQSPPRFTHLPAAQSPSLRSQALRAGCRAGVRRQRGVATSTRLCLPPLHLQRRRERQKRRSSSAAHASRYGGGLRKIEGEEGGAERAPCYERGSAATPRWRPKSRVPNTDSGRE